MNLSLMTRRFSLLLICLGAFSAVPVRMRAQMWATPTPEELKMTSQAGAAGAPAVVLYQEQTADDSLHMFSYYTRVKVLTEGGKDKANVELPFVSFSTYVAIDSIAGRTIHADGTVVPFEGKPYDKLIEKAAGYKVKAKVFTLPAVEVGSILEYRYKLRYDDNFFRSPDWYIQGDLFVRKAHYSWTPTTKELSSEEEGGVVSNIAWTPILPAGATVKQSAPNGRTGAFELSLDLTNIPALAYEEFMPPPESLSYRVLFYWTSHRTLDEYWKAAGKRWSNAQNKLIGPNKGVKEFVEKTVAANDAPEVKLKKLYDAVMKMENTNFTRQRSTQEEKAAGLKDVSTTDDILKRQRGNGDQLNALFVAMARAAGFKAYSMGVANRSKRVFIGAYLNLNQLDDDIAIVTVDGKDEYFDPGQRYCEFRHLAWVHAATGGLRQTDAGTQLSMSPGETYKEAHVLRIADLTLDEHGEATGTVKMTYNGDPALTWRQEALRGDITGLKGDLKSGMERLLPGGMDVKITNIQDLENYDKPLVVEYEVKGAVGSPTGKRLLVQANLFQVNAKPAFPESTREHVVYMHYPSFYQDAVRIKYPATMAIESTPAATQDLYQKQVMYTTSSKQAPGSITTFRNVQIADCLFEVKEYPALRAFYNKLEAKDQEPLVMIHANAASASAASPVATSK